MRILERDKEGEKNARRRTLCGTVRIFFERDDVVAQKTLCKSSNYDRAEYNKPPMMKQLNYIALILVFIALYCLPCKAVFTHPDLQDKSHSFKSLSKFALSPQPWISITANSEQRNPMFIGATPRAMVFGGPLADQPTLRSLLKEVGEKHAQLLLKALKVREAEFEVWPTQNDDGDQTWVFARWRTDPRHCWGWVDEKLFKGDEEVDPPENPDPILPVKLRPWVKADHDSIFMSFLERESLYDKPVFGDTVWTSKDGKKIISAWMNLSLMEKIKATLAADRNHVAYLVPQPPRFNAEPITFLIKVSRKAGIEWPENIHWKKESEFIPAALTEPIPSIAFSPHYRQNYENDIRILGGEKKAVFPISRKKMRFTRKSSAQTNHQLNDLVQYLEERYKKLGIRTVRLPFSWRIDVSGKKVDIPQSNLVAVIPGSLRGKHNRPVLFADHIDTVFAGDTFEKTGQRITVVGADDNVSATATLLRAAEELKMKKPLHDIWLLHLTGEEYPADDMGIRTFLEDHLRGPQGWSPAHKALMGNKEDFGGLILLDMIGYRPLTSRTFQINMGEGWEDHKVGSIAVEAAKVYAREWTAEVRTRFDARSYLYNTDGYIFDHYGYPVVFFNETLHRYNLDSTGNPHYHLTTDVADNLDFDFATAIGKTAIATTLRLANPGKNLEIIQKPLPEPP